MGSTSPQPRIKYKHVQKRQNGADQFREQHRNDYELRDDHKGDVIKRVRRHNKAVPKLKDELKKRKSIITVTTINLKDINCDFDPSCSACAKLITLNELQRLNIKPRCLRSNNKQTKTENVKETVKENDPEKLSVCDEKKIQDEHSRPRQKLIGVKKLKPTTKRQIDKYKTALTNKSCQHIVDKHQDDNCNSPRTSKSSQDENCNSPRTSKTSQDENLKEDVIAETEPNDYDEEQPVTNYSGRKFKGNEKSSVHTLKSGNGSKSSYNSYLSMDHEPMDYN